MSNTNNRMIVFASILGAILATSILALNPSTITNAGAQPYGDHQYGYDSNYYYQDDNRYSYDNNNQKKSYGDIQKIKCVNSNINVNGIDITRIPEDDTATAAANEGADVKGAQNGNGWGDKINFDRNLVNICVNVNDNEQVKVTTPEPPTPCEGCFSDLSQQQIDDLFPIVITRATIDTVQELCDYLEALTRTLDKQTAYVVLFNALASTPSITPTQASAILTCLEQLGLIIAV